jgi:hypothetical protein
VKRSMDGVHEEGDPRMLDNSKLLHVTHITKAKHLHCQKGRIK